MNARWATDPQYSHCYFVPVLVLWSLWVKRHFFPVKDARPALAGVLLLLAAAAMRAAADWCFFEFLDFASLVVACLGLIGLLEGWEACRWALPSVLLLSFMIPLPFRIHSALAQPLQAITAQGAAYLLQSLGRPAFSEGHLISLGGHSISVVDACCGLGMIFVFLFLAAAIAIFSRRPLFDRAMLFVAAPFVAVMVNIVRIAATAEAGALNLDSTSKALVHDLAGWLMVPLALLLMWIMLMIFSLLFPPANSYDDPLAIAFQLESANRSSTPKRSNDR